MAGRYEICFVDETEEKNTGGENNRRSKTTIQISRCTILSTASTSKNSFAGRNRNPSKICQKTLNK